MGLSRRVFEQKASEGWKSFSQLIPIGEFIDFSSQFAYRIRSIEKIAVIRYFQSCGILRQCRMRDCLNLACMV